MDRSPGRPAFAGIDTHGDTNMLGLKDALGREIGTWEFPAGPEGYAALADAIGDAGIPVGVEGTRSYGRGLTDHLLARGFDVYEVIRPGRGQRRRGKCDAADALAACDSVAAGRALPVKRLDGELCDLRALYVAREGCVREMDRVANTVGSLLVTGDPEARERWRGMSAGARMAGLSRTRPRDATGRVLRDMAREWADARERAAGYEAEMASILSRAFPRLLGAPSVGTVTAAAIVLAAGSNPERLRDEAAFSMLCGTSPIPASSGKTSRHRLNRGGDRRANWAVHRIALSRLQHEERTKGYVARKVSEGKSTREAIRCLCRYIARELYKLLTGPQEVPCDQSSLAARRARVGATQAEAAEATGLTRSKIGRLERMVEFDTEALEAYDRYLRQREPELTLDNG